MAVFRPLTPDHKVDLGQVAPPAERSLADLLPPTPPAPPPAAPAPPAVPPRLSVSSRAQIAALLVAGAIVLLAALFLAQNVPPPAPRVVDPPTHTSAPPASPSAPAPPQQPRTALQRLPRAVVAYAAPEGAVLGSIEPGRAYTPTGRLGDDWTRIAAAGSGVVWVRAGELAPDASLLDLATPTPRPQPTAPPVPTQCAVVSGGGMEVQRCGLAPLDQLEADARAAWRAQFGGNTAPIATMTPYGGKP